MGRLILAVSLLVLAGAARADPGCQLQVIAELPVALTNGQPTVEAFVNERPIHMITDTGSDSTLLFRAAAKELGLTPVAIPGAKFYGVGGGDDDMSALIKEFKVSNFVANNVDIAVTGQWPSSKIQGLLGVRLLMQADLEFDLPQDKIRLIKSKNCKGDQVVYWGAAYASAPMEPATGNGIYVDVLVNGARVRAQLDSGAAYSVLTPAAAKRAGITPQSTGVARDGVSQGTGSALVDTYIGIFSSFSFGDETIKNAKLRIADLFEDDKEVPINSHIAASVVDGPQMLLGADFLRSHRVYISHDQKRVYASYVGGPVFRIDDQPPAATTTAPAASPK